MDFHPLSSWFNTTVQPFLIAGPCGAESFEQLDETVRRLKTAVSPHLIRAGVWKPRTRPDSFEGRGEEALKWLKEIRERYQLPVTVEVANPKHVELALRYGVDVLWIGARTTVNPFSVQEIANALAGVSVPVMVKNPIHADLQLWIGAIERLHRAGIHQLAAIHRGFHRYGYSTYRNDPMWQLPIELRTHLPTLPIVCDPSHIAGKRNLIAEIAQKSLDLGVDGLMIESHCDPDHALSDATQQLTPEALATLLSQLVIRSNAGANDSADTLVELRQAIDEIDMDILRALSKRQEVIEKIAEHKARKQMTIFQLERWQEILRTRGQWADQLGISRTHVERLCQFLHEESIRLQNLSMNDQVDLQEGRRNNA
jgi:chorismate mutase